jgi:hypothetical protein
VNRVERLAKQIEAAKTLELKLAEAHVRNCGGTLQRLAAVFYEDLTALT